MFQAFGLVRMAELATWLLPTSSLASYGLIATQLHRSGFLSPRLIALVPTQALVLVAVSLSLSTLATSRLEAQLTTTANTSRQFLGAALQDVLAD